MSTHGEDESPDSPRPLTQVPPPPAVTGQQPVVDVPPRVSDPTRPRARAKDTAAARTEVVPPPEQPTLAQTPPPARTRVQTHTRAQSPARPARTERFVPQTYSLAPGDPQVLGSYRLLGRIISPDVAGDHNRPVVFLAEGPDQVLVVVKAASLDAGWEALERLTREGRNAAQITGTQVAAIVQGADEDLGYRYIVQQYVHGTPLDVMLAQKPDGRLAPEDAYRLAVGLLSALRAVHDAGVIHRDIKPGNVIVTIDGPVIVDFGNSHHQDDDRVTTSGGRPWGTPRYMAPEQFDGLSVSPAIDLFGWAVTVVEAASGHHPFTADRSAAYEQVNGRIMPNVSGVPVDLVPAVRTALETDPHRRTTAGFLERRLARPDLTRPQPHGVVDVPLPEPPSGVLDRLDLPSVDPGAWRTRFEDALVDGNRTFLIACVVAVLLAAPAGVILHVLMGLVFR